MCSWPASALGLPGRPPCLSGVTPLTSPFRHQPCPTMRRIYGRIVSCCLRTCSVPYSFSPDRSCRTAASPPPAGPQTVRPLRQASDSRPRELWVERRSMLGENECFPPKLSNDSTLHFQWFQPFAPYLSISSNLSLSTILAVPCAKIEGDATSARRSPDPRRGQRPSPDDALPSHRLESPSTSPTGRRRRRSRSRLSRHAGPPGPNCRLLPHRSQGRPDVRPFPQEFRGIKPRRDRPFPPAALGIPGACHVLSFHGGVGLIRVHP